MSNQSRENPPPDGFSGLWLVAAAAAAVLLGAAIVSRNANAMPAPNPNGPTPVPTPRPTQTPRPTTPVRQPSGFTPTSHAAVRVLQQQLLDMGYTITEVDGDYGPETTAAVQEFLRIHSLAPGTSPLQVMLAVDTVYGRTHGGSAVV